MKTTKRTISMIAALAMVFSTMTVSVQAASSKLDFSKTIVSGNYRYKVVSLKGKKGTATLVGAKSKKIAIVKMPKTVKVKGYKFTVTAIGNNAFKKYKNLKTVKTNTVLKKIGNNAFANCAKLSKITISSKKLESVGKNALKGINNNAVIEVPSSSSQTYNQLLSSKGQTSSVKILTSGVETLSVDAAQIALQVPVATVQVAATQAIKTQAVKNEIVAKKAVTKEAETSANETATQAQPEEVTSQAAATTAAVTMPETTAPAPATTTAAVTKPATKATEPTTTAVVVPETTTTEEVTTAAVTMPETTTTEPATTTTTTITTTTTTNTLKTNSYKYILGFALLLLVSLTLGILLLIKKRRSNG